jgi:hypothetical protein
MSRTSLSIGRPWLSLDHTFKSVSNIGLVRLADKKWIKQYSGLFCILNADGEILSWKLTETLSFEHMKDALVMINERFKQQGKVVSEFYIDNCCPLRNK